MKTISLKEYVENKNNKNFNLAYIWTECGRGAMEKINYIMRDWWVKTGDNWGMSYCCHPQTQVFIFESLEEMNLICKKMQEIFKQRMKHFDEMGGKWDSEKAKKIPQYPY